jgi:hypothetical protein
MGISVRQARHEDEYLSSVILQCLCRLWLR